MSILSHILTSHVVQSKGCYIYRETLHPVPSDPALYVVGGACKTLTIGPNVLGGSNIYGIIDRWLSDNEGTSAPAVGVRVDPDTHDVHVDMCTLTPLKSIARLRAKDRGQRVIWDMVNGVAIPVCGDMTWRELAKEIASFPDEVMDSPALVFDSVAHFHRVEGLNPYDIDEPVSITNPPSIDLREED